MKTIVVLAISFLWLPLCMLSFSGDGEGTEMDPYQISNVQQLQEIYDDLDAYYILMNNLNARQTKDWNNGKGFVPIGEYVEHKPFKGFIGYLNGNGYNIDSLFINRPEENDIGLFGCIADGAEIHNLIISNVDIIGRENTGTLSGHLYIFDKDSTVNISECTVTGNVNGLRHAGGAIGFNHIVSGRLVITNCSTNITINTGGDRAGGMVGRNEIYEAGGFIIIEDSHTAGAIFSQGSYVGGFIGENKCNTVNNIISIKSCKSEVEIKESTGAVGGFIGLNKTSKGNSSIVIDSCFAFGNVSSSNSGVGGFCGINSGGSENSVAIIRFCYSSGKVVTQGNQAGGFVGQNDSRSSNAILAECYATGDVIWSGQDIDKGYFFGGFCGHLYSSPDLPYTSLIMNCFSTGNIRANSRVGGFCGGMESFYPRSMTEIRNCYSLGEPIGGSYVGGFCGRREGDGVYPTSNCYWDNSTSNIHESDGGESIKTSDMKKEETYNNWDFDNIWCILEGETYPHLQKLSDCTSLVDVVEIPLTYLINIFPNPANGKIFVHTNDMLIDKISVVDIYGKIILEVLQCNTQKHEIDISNIASGYYYLNIITSKMNYTKPFIILH